MYKRFYPNYYMNDAFKKSLNGEINTDYWNKRIIRFWPKYGRLRILSSWSEEIRYVNSRKPIKKNLPNRRVRI